MSYNTKNYTEQGGDRTVIGGELKFEEGAVISGDGAADLAAVATETTLGGVKAATKGAGDTVEVKIDGTSKKLYVPTYPVLPTAATASTAGLVSMAANVEAVATEGALADVITALNALLAALKAAGTMAADG